MQGVTHTSETWRAIRRHISDRINSLHLSLESPMDERETAVIRGRILELRALMDRVEGPVDDARRFEQQEQTNPEPSLY